MEPNPNSAEAERLLGVAEKLLNQRDLKGSKEFAILAQETDPLLDGSDKLLAAIDVLLAAEKRTNNHLDWYSILQINGRTDDQDLIKKQYRKLALLLHPDKNKYPFADQAFTLVVEAWNVLSRGTDDGGDQRSRLSSFWTACPYCYVLYEYQRVYVNCCLRCENCKRGFHAALIPNFPPLVPGKDAYYCCWGFFPLGFVGGNSEKGGAPASGFPNWMPPLSTGGNAGGGGAEVVKAARVNRNVVGVASGQKRGRPRKYRL